MTEDEMVHGITNSMDVNLSKSQELVMDMEAWCAAVHALTAFLRPPKVPRHAGFPRGEHRGSRHRFL